MEKTAGPTPKTGPDVDPARAIQLWDGGYRKRARSNGTFLICKSEYTELHDPPVLSKEHFLSIFGRVPGTRNPPGITQE
jgi:hypothetical protein